MARKKQVRKVGKKAAKTEAKKAVKKAAEKAAETEAETAAETEGKTEAKSEGKMAQEKMTERLITVVLTLVVAGVLGVVGTALGGGALIGALGGVQETEPTFDQQVGTLSDRVQALQAKIEGATRVPTGAVMAFDLATGCPEDGWTEFADAAGRTIIGQGSGMDDKNGKPLTGRKYRGHGGEEKVTLTVKEMPAHVHELNQRDFLVPRGGAYGAGTPKMPDNTGAPVTLRIGETGKNAPHNNMPPYIALYFCKKG